MYRKWDTVNTETNFGGCIEVDCTCSRALFATAHRISKRACHAPEGHTRLRALRARRDRNLGRIHPLICNYVGTLQRPWLVGNRGTFPKKWPPVPGMWPIRGAFARTDNLNYSGTNLVHFHGFQPFSPGTAGKKIQLLLQGVPRA